MKRFVAFFFLGLMSIVLLAPAASASSTPNKTKQRVLIISLPNVDWADLQQVHTPNLDRLFKKSAIGSISTRGVRRRTSLGDGYTTIGAGTRAVGDTETDGQAFQKNEIVGSSSASSIYERRIGKKATGNIVNLGIANILSKNKRLPYDAKIGAFADALTNAGVQPSVIANADGNETGLETQPYARQAALALTGSTGQVRNGEVDGHLLEKDSSAAFGVRLQTSAVVHAFQDSWKPGSVVVVEASDLARADAYGHFTTSHQHTRLLNHAIQRTDALVGQLLQHVDLSKDAVLVVGPAPSQSNVSLTPVAWHAPNVSGGTLSSPSTRRTGVVELVDIAPTVLHFMGISRPASMEGRAFDAPTPSGSLQHRETSLVRMNAAAEFRDSQVVSVTAAFVILQLLLVIATVLILRFHIRFVGAITRFGALAGIGFLIAIYLATLIRFYNHGALWYWIFLITVAICYAAMCQILFSRRAVDALMAAFSGLVLLLLVDIVTGARLQLNAVFGYSPTVGGRFAGIGNLSFSALGASALFLAALLVYRFPGRRGRVLAAIVLAAVVVVDAAPGWGGDVGGTLSAVPACGLTAYLLWGGKIRWRTIITAMFAGVAAVGVAATIDLLGPASKHTHLARLVEQVRGQGWQSFFTVISRKLGENLGVVTKSLWTLMLPAVFILIAYLVWRVPGRLQEIREEIPELRAALFGLLVLAVLGFSFNDSGIALPGLMLAVLNMSLIYLILSSQRVAVPVPEIKLTEQSVRT